MSVGQVRLSITTICDRHRPHDFVCLALLPLTVHEISYFFPDSRSLLRWLVRGHGRRTTLDSQKRPYRLSATHGEARKTAQGPESGRSARVHSNSGEKNKNKKIRGESCFSFSPFGPPPLRPLFLLLYFASFFLVVGSGSDGGRRNQ